MIEDTRGLRGFGIIENLDDQIQCQIAKLAHIWSSDLGHESDGGPIRTLGVPSICSNDLRPPLDFLLNVLCQPELQSTLSGGKFSTSSIPLVPCVSLISTHPTASYSQPVIDLRRMACCRSIKTIFYIPFCWPNVGYHLAANHLVFGFFSMFHVWERYQYVRIHVVEVHFSRAGLT